MASQFWLQVTMRWRIMGGIALVLIALRFMFDVYDLDMFSWDTYGLKALVHNDPPPLPPADKEEYVALCLAVKDQHLDLPEFLVHHYFHLGIRRFYIMDDGSIPPLSTTISPKDYGIDPSAVTFEYFPPEQHQAYMQPWIYDRCHEQYGKNHTWMAFIDADEFFEVVDRSTTFVDYLKEFENQTEVGAIAINWQIHSSNGHLIRQDSCREAYTTCIYDDPQHGGEASDNKHIKSIVKMADYKRTLSPHTFDTGDRKTVGEDGKEYAAGTSPWRQPITRSRVALHHYAVKSRQEYEDKKERGNAMGQPKGNEFWDHIETMPHVKCPEMAKYYP